MVEVTGKVPTFSEEIMVPKDPAGKWVSAKEYHAIMELAAKAVIAHYKAPESGVASAAMQRMPD